ncbi:glycosyltransferase family 2 protein [Mariniflexile sp. AS56]|uniref:glycosyltransferase family 2 protein n=1 Tax=Mariniflexile sp. AS56 TaxID=3063957 RepID=UPI0026F068D2|nr:glycosyltransferase family A protein [Mariniflexile sp. AS56]MDO7172709.1 glycosyltransferase family A protein [Mariniflexile sp. AS56]
MDKIFSLIICTYMRPKSLIKLLESVLNQSVYPNEILIIDGSTNNETNIILKENSFKNLKYFKVDDENRGLTKQRNYGVNLIQNETEIVCFLDDDTVLETDYFEAVIAAFNSNPDVVGVGGVAINENRWKLMDKKVTYPKSKYYKFENYVIKESLRNIVRNYFNLQSYANPSVMPSFSHGRTYSYPLTGKNHEVDLLVGMSFSFKRIVFKNIKFSTYFEGYGLYEDADFSIRALKFGKNVIATNAKLFHYHEPLGRPNQYKYGKMVVRNGWYVWRVKYPNPEMKAILKWNATVILLTLIRFTNILNTTKRKEALTESLGRVVGWLSLIFNKPRIEN